MRDLTTAAAILIAAAFITCGFGPNCRAGSGWKPDCSTCDCPDLSTEEMGP
jgi:hypothetical protein